MLPSERLYTLSGTMGASVLTHVAGHATGPASRKGSNVQTCPHTAGRVEERRVCSKAFLSVRVPLSGYAARGPFSPWRRGDPPAPNIRQRSQRQLAGVMPLEMQGILGSTPSRRRFIQTLRCRASKSPSSGGMEFRPRPTASRGGYGTTQVGNGQQHSLPQKYLAAAVPENTDKVIAKLHYKLGEYSKVVCDVEAALEGSPHDVELHLLLGDAYSQLGQRKKGAQARLKALELDPGEGQMPGDLALREAREDLEEGMYEAAISLAMAALDSMDTPPSQEVQAELFGIISEAQSRLGHDVAAVEAELLAVEASPLELRPRLVLLAKQTEMAFHQGDLPAATDLATQGLALAHEFGNGEFHETFHGYRGKARLLEGDFEHALPDLEEYAKLRPSDPEPLALLSEAHWELGDLQRAAEAQEGVVRLEPRNHGAKLVLASRLQALLAKSRGHM